MSPTMTLTSSVGTSSHQRSASTGYVGQSDYRVHKHHRKVSSTGGGRAWTEEEEEYLLRTRLHKMPYKHIAAHLKKTELACRLHYHQMSYGSNRRRRTDSISSTGSYTTTPGPRDPPDNLHYTQLSPVPSPPSSPELGSQKAVSSDSNHFQPQRAPVPILPKPEPTGTPLLQSTSADATKSLRLDTSIATSNSRAYVGNRNYIDQARLQALYEAHRSSFWSLIASEYSHDSTFSGRQLEEAFFANLPSTNIRAASPPTPGPSPQEGSPGLPNRYLGAHMTSSVMSQGFHAVNGAAPISTASKSASSSPSSVERCSVSALLTVEKEVRPSKEISTEAAT
ncbi:hypothetical protein VTN77DRAFT_7904 [Rasamsonia byssochlamydoides]|uniref:uncharacterized protein n=1 Tax=Rasamsonia byssochlamydoides TaxID=89139 RepID=UPI003743E0C1